MRTLGKLFLLLLVGGGAIVAWEIFRSQQRPSPSFQPPASPYTAPPPAQPGAPQQPAGPAPVNLAIVSAGGIQQAGGRAAQLTVHNYGPGTATGVSGWCSYRCPSTGVAVNNQVFLQGGYLVPGRSVSGLLPLTPCPDPNLYLECVVEPGPGPRDSAPNDNRWTGTVANR